MVDVPRQMLVAAGVTVSGGRGRMSTVFITESVGQPRAETPFSTSVPVVLALPQVTCTVLVPWPLVMVPPTVRQLYEAGTGPAAV